MARGVVKTILVRDDSDVCQATEEYERAKLILLFHWRR
jgi:hypothetical protein